MIRPQFFQARLADKIQLNDKFIHFYFELVQPNLMEFEAGQYVSITVPGEHPARRSYSICSSPAKNHGFELLVDVTPQGVGTKYLESLAFGQELQCLAPMGMMVVQPTVTDDIIFVATGSGIAPFRSMILDQLQVKRNTKHIYLYWGLRYVEQMFWEDEFEELMRDFPNFHYHPVISQALPEWPLCRGRVTDCLTIHQQPAVADYFLCGNAPMLESVNQILADKQVPKERIHVEKFH